MDKWLHTTTGSPMRIMFVGEAWGRDEAAIQRPFVGVAGMELFRQLLDAGLLPKEEAQRVLYCIRADMRHYSKEEGFGHYHPIWPAQRDRLLSSLGFGLTNVFNLRPEGNKIESLTLTKKELPLGYPTALPSLAKRFLAPRYLPELERLRAELQAASPNLVVALGATALWALCRSSAISGLRGSVCLGAQGGPASGLKVLPTFHPSAIIRGRQEWRVICIADLMKAARECSTPNFARPARSVLCNPTLSELKQWIATMIGPVWHQEPLGVDCETAKGQITCISFAHLSTRAITIPFRNKSATANYWEHETDEICAWSAVRRLLSCGRPLVFQNGMYDMQYLARMGFDCSRAAEDTMLLAHSLYPELQKSLGFLGSIWTNEPSWKMMRKQRATTIKGEKLDE